MFNSEAIETRLMYHYHLTKIHKGYVYSNHYLYSFFSLCLYLCEWGQPKRTGRQRKTFWFSSLCHMGFSFAASLCTLHPKPCCVLNKRNV